MGIVDDKIPNWIWKVLPVLTGYQDSQCFEIWLYSKLAETLFPQKVYLELISFNFRDNPLKIFDVLNEFISFEERQKLKLIVKLFREKEIFSTDFSYLNSLNLPDNYIYHLKDSLLDIYSQLEICRVLKHQDKCQKYQQKLETYLIELEKHILDTGVLPHLDILKIK
ncbi:hypothetical protein [Rodentibacter caecimuris]|uniref:hypothetical protein n=1 Tax=Rodentibacter caecimuris TaxID=1796644 RepID=UPI0013A09BDF|nr:hypothetical protein [Rodentibacter heylii]QIA77347.1 hypothetical protein FEE42_08280 [Rodentibacter heylii]